MEKLLIQIDEAIERYQRFNNNYVVSDLIVKMEEYKRQLLALSQRMN